MLFNISKLSIRGNQTHFAQGNGCPVLFKRKLLQAFHEIECSYHSVGTNTKIAAGALRSPKVKDILSKAFDTVTHNILLSKLRQWGLGEWTGRWIENWLNGRSQRIVISGTGVSWRPVTSGVPQGSVLGPALFNLLISDSEEGTGVCSASSLRQGCEEWLILQSAVQPFRGTPEVREMGREKPSGIQQRQMQVLYLGRNNPRHWCKLGADLLESSSEEDLEVLVDNKLSLSQLGDRRLMVSWGALGRAMPAGQVGDPDPLLSPGEAQLECSVQFWVPQYKRHGAPGAGPVEAAEMLKGLEHLLYEERLRELGLFSLESRH
ncbi:rna-directed dna polymerase from mobile element jockey-like [Willisornis vidua]|uniref:Rna-directed dna polymerase from mobile element jockey-like n=1 Tax=Willisornis vidua TaxID=1566151 RepID=A0ABQ9CTQ8_9PASS|nr:rna-directed dna polymerase from mobile element jockey-like [Willisornis vidua]